MDKTMDMEVAKRVDVALREVISNLVVANTELKIRVELLMAKLPKPPEEPSSERPPLKAVD